MIVTGGFCKDIQYCDLAIEFVGVRSLYIGYSNCPRPTEEALLEGFKLFVRIM